MGKAETGISVGNTDEFVVFCYAFTTRKRTGFDLTSAETNCEVSNGDIFRFAGTMRHDSVKSSTLGKHHGINGFR